MDAREFLTGEAVEVFAYGIERRLRPGEDLGNVFAFVGEVATQRALQNGRRQPSPLDAEVVASAYCWWPLKPSVPDSYEEVAANVRQFALRDFSTVLRFDPRSLPPALLSAPAEEIYDLFERGDASWLGRP